MFHPFGQALPFCQENVPAGVFRRVALWVELHIFYETFNGYAGVAHAFDKGDVIINEKQAEKLGITIPDSIKQEAKNVSEEPKDEGDEQ